MSASTRTRRATVYPYVGTNDGGYSFSSYGVARGTYWCRLSPIPGVEGLLDDQVGIVDRATIEFADEVPVEEHDLIVMDDNVQWKAGPVTTRTMQRAKVLRVERSTEMVELRTGLAAATVPDTIVEGGHADDDFDNPFDDATDGGDASTP